MLNRAPDLHALRGILLALGSAALLPFGRLSDPGAGWPIPGGHAPVVVLAGFFASCLALLFGALLLPSRPRTARSLASSGVVLAVLLTVASSPKEPALGFLLLLAAAALLARIWPLSGDREVRPRSPDDVAPLARASARGAAMAGLGAWVLAVPAEWAVGGPEILAAALPLGVGALLAGRWAWLARRLGNERTRLVLTGTALSVMGVGLLPLVPIAGLVILGAGPPLTLLGTRCSPPPSALGRPVTAFEALLTHPARALVATFGALCAIGTVLLSLPLATTRPITFVDALFTAVSATCVTGLAVLDTPVDLTFAGQALLLLLIQVGGLGILTFSTATAALIGRRLSVRHEGAMAGMLGAEGTGDVFRAVRAVLRVTFVVEGTGAFTLTALFFAQGDAFPAALWQGVFTAVSAYCNAGFALKSDNLVSYQGAPAVLHVVAALITLGGLGPVIVLALPAWTRGHASLQTRLAIVTGALLAIGPAFVFGAMEWTNTLGELPWPDRIHNAWFQSVTLRTAGFNSIDLTALNPGTRTLMIVCMFVGGSPGSTAGGIKTTTAALLVLAVVAAIRGRSEATAFGRRIPHLSVYKAAAIATVGLASVGTTLLALQLTQRLPDHVLLFEAVSALGTVGLTVGATSSLDDVGRIIIASAMFMGRVGPLTLFLLLTERVGTRGVNLPEESVAVG